MTNKIEQLEKVFNDAIIELTETFGELKAEIISVDKPEYKTVKRPAKVGEQILITNPRDDSAGEKGEVFTVVDVGREFGHVDVDEIRRNGVWAFMLHEYEVLVPELETVKRVAEVGERIIVTNPIDTHEQYGKGDVFTVASIYVREGVFTKELREEFEGDDVFISHSEYEVIIEPEQVPVTKELTPNEKRVELIERAKGFWDENADDDFHCEVDEEKRTVFVYKVIATKNGGYRAVTGLAACPIDKVFNEFIVMAIALARALEINVPVEFLNAVQPDEIVAGMRVSSHDNMDEYTVGQFYKEEKLDGDYGKAFFPVGWPAGTWLGVDQVKIINDTNAIY